MLLGQLIDSLCDRFKVSRTDPSRAVLKDKVNLIYREIGNITNVTWQNLKRTGEIATVPNYATGTCTITYGSNTITFSGSTLTSAMAGRFFKPAGSNNWYLITAVPDASTLTLRSPILDTSGSGKTFAIWKRYYYFPSEVKRLIEFESPIRNGELFERSLQSLHDNSTNISLTGDPDEFVMYGEDTFATAYTTGTITLTQDSVTATGVGTAWLANVNPGDRLEIGKQILRVKRVNSDTSIELINAASTASGAYSIKKDANLGFQLYYSPNSEMILPYTYVKRVYDLVNENYDRPELPEDFDLAILDGAEAMRLKDLDDARWINQIAIYASRVNDLKVTRFVSSPRYRQMSPRITSRGSYLGGTTNWGSYGR